MRATLVRWGVALGVLLLGAGAGFAEEKDSGKKGADLALVSHDGSGFVAVRVGEIWQKAEGLRKLAKEDAFMGQILGELDKALGAKPEEIERLLMIFPNEEKSDPIVVVTFAKPYDRTRITTGVVPESEEKKASGKTYLVSSKTGNALHFLNDRTFVFSSPTQLPRFLEQPVSKSGPLDAALTAAGGKHDLVLALDVGKLLKDSPPVFEPYVPLLKARGSTITLDLTDKAAIFKGVFPYESEDEAKAGEKAAREGAEKLRSALPQAITEIGKLPDNSPQKALVGKLAPFLQDAETALKDAKVTREGKVVRAEVSVKTKDPASGTVTMVFAWFMAVRSGPVPPTQVEEKPIKPGT